MSTKRADKSGRRHGRGIGLTVRDVYEGDSIEVLIPPEVVVIPKGDEAILKEVDANAETWIRADELIDVTDQV